MSSAPVAAAVARALVREHWAGLRGFPSLEEGQVLLLRALQDCCLSVDHARQVARTFNNLCPTPKEVADVAYNVRDRFAPKEKWVKEEGVVYDPAFRAALLGSFGQQISGSHLQALRDMLSYTEGPGRNEFHDRRFWGEARFRDLKDYPEAITALRAGRAPAPDDLVPVWKRKKVRAAGVTSPIDAPAITEADVDAAKVRYEQEKERMRGEVLRETERPLDGVEESFDDGYREPEEESMQ